MKISDMRYCQDHGAEFLRRGAQLVGKGDCQVCAMRRARVLRNVRSNGVAYARIRDFSGEIIPTAKRNENNAEYVEVNAIIDSINFDEVVKTFLIGSDDGKTTTITQNLKGQWHNGRKLITSTAAYVIVRAALSNDDMVLYNGEKEVTEDNIETLL